MRNFKMTLCAMTLAAVSTSALALSPGQGQVTFNGELVTDTCTISTDSQDLQVPLPTLSTQTLASEGVTAGTKSFELKVENCPTSITKVAAHFEAIGSTGVDNETGNLINDYKGSDPKADKVEVRLYDANQQQLKIGETSTPVAVNQNDATATMTFYGSYYATGQTTAGKVLATALYTLAYP